MELVLASPAHPFTLLARPPPPQAATRASCTQCCPSPSATRGGPTCPPPPAPWARLTATQPTPRATCSCSCMFGRWGGVFTSAPSPPESNKRSPQQPPTHTHARARARRFQFAGCVYFGGRLWESADEGNRLYYNAGRNELPTLCALRRSRTHARACRACCRCCWGRVAALLLLRCCCGRPRPSIHPPHAPTLPLTRMHTPQGRGRRDPRLHSRDQHQGAPLPLLLRAALRALRCPSACAHPPVCLRAHACSHTCALEHACAHARTRRSSSAWWAT